MQTKKRAKPVKFGNTNPKAEPKEIKDLPAGKAGPQEEKEIEEMDEVEEEESKDMKVTTKEPHDDEEKEAPEDEEEKDEDPDEIDLSKELEEDDKDDASEKDEEDKEEKSSFAKSSEDKEDDEEKESKDEMNDEVTAEKEKETEEDEEKDSEKEEESEKQEKEAAEEKFAKYGSFTREEVLAPKKKSPWGSFILIALIAFAVGLALIAGGSYFLSNFDTKNIELPSLSQATPTPTTEPTATPTPEKADLSTYSIKVLNGSGISGEASSLKTQLEDADFVVDGVGNAATDDYTKTEVFAKKSVSDAYINELIKELKKTYQVNSVTNTLDDSESVDVEVIIGSDKAE